MIMRLYRATRYAFKGVFYALRHEFAFRLEVLLAIVLVPFVFYLRRDGAESALLIASILLILIVELVNSAIEATVDRVGQEPHVLSGAAKDLGAAAVFVSILNAFLTWWWILLW